MFTCVIIDDEPNASKTLAFLLKEHCPHIEVQAIYNRPDIALAELKGKTPDIIFLDVEMPFLNGFAFLDELKPAESNVIFTTAYDQFAIKAFQYSAFDYLLKPINPSDLINSVNRLAKEKKSFKSEHLNHLLDIYKNINSQLPQRIALPTTDGYDFIEISTILYAEASDNYSHLHITNHTKPLIVSKTLKEIEQILSPHNFLRIHHSFLVNKHHIQKILKADGGFIQLSSGIELPMSRRRKNEIIELLTGH